MEVNLRRKLLEIERQLEEERRQREQAEHQREEETRRREEAEELTKASQPQTLRPYLEACHKLNLAITIVTDPSSTTQGEPTAPASRKFPQRIIPWHDFAAKQESVWNQLSTSESFSSRPTFPAPIQLEYVLSVLYPISSEDGLRYFERDTVENAVRKLFDEAYKDSALRSILDLPGSITFESLTNLGNANDDISQDVQSLSIGSDSAITPVTPKITRHRARGMGNHADQFCIYKDVHGQNVPVVAIEYKPPHKLSKGHIRTGLQSEVRPENDVINVHEDGFEFESKLLATAVITQLFSYMIGKGVKYGYICTGEVFVFLFIPEDPATVYYHISEPSLDVVDDDENKLHCTAVSRVFALILQAALAKPPPQSWHDAADGLGTWAVEFYDILKDIPQTKTTKKQKQKEKRNAIPYHGRKGPKRSPIRTRSRCKPPERSSVHRSDEDEDDESGPPSPSPNQPGSLTRASLKTSVTRASGKDQAQESQRRPPAGKKKIQDRPFCTQECLLGLAYGRPMDTTCPNIKDHGAQHISRSEFICLTRDQLAVDRGHDADCVPLYLAGSLGALFKVRLSSHGYTLVAKGMERPDVSRLKHEHDIYCRLQPIQGKHVPVCLGITDLILPYYYDCGVYTDFLFLGWAGLPIYKCPKQLQKLNILQAIRIAYTSLHQLRVLHLDAEPRNVLFDIQTGKVMIVDFERAKALSRQPLNSISPNCLAQKRKRGTKERSISTFSQELQLALSRFSKCIEGC